MKMYSGVLHRVGTPHMKMCSSVHHRMGTPHMKMCSVVLTGVGTPHNFRDNLGSWVGGCQDAKSCHFVDPSFKLELARFSVKLSIPDGAECGNRTTGLEDDLNHLTQQRLDVPQVV